ncbi:MAG: hypothetical protein F6K00_33230 [Leptolyngbya sp. SIOISBB]|nr:hypothetical protein [Leptolyngbya sp. SIOISBB]
MSSVPKSQKCPKNAVPSPIPDPWNTRSEEHTVSRPESVVLDPSHELTGRPARTAMMPQGVPKALRLPKHTGPIRSAIAILLEDELKLAEPVNTPLGDHIRDAIAVLEFASP